MPKLGRALLFFLVLAAMLMVATCMYGYVARIDTFAVRAQLAAPEYLANLAAERVGLDAEGQRQLADRRPTVAAHRLQPGAGVVFAYRSFTPGTLARGDESYQKTTLWLATPPAEGETELDVSDRDRVFAVISKGSSSWPALSCAGYLANGTIKVNRSEQSYRIAVTGQFTPQGTTVVPDYCEQGPFELNFRAAETPVEALTPWHGRSDGDVMHETYRP